MSVHKIVCLCGAGLGSSIIMHMNAEEAVKQLGHPEIFIDHGTVAAARADAADLFVVGRALVHEIHGVPQDRIVVLENMLDKEEIEQKLARAIQ